MVMYDDNLGGAMKYIERQSGDTINPEEITHWIDATQNGAVDGLSLSEDEVEPSNVHNKDGGVRRIPAVLFKGVYYLLDESR